MIAYTLICDKDHQFQEHFENYDDCETKLKASAMVCPACGSNQLTKGLSAPSVGGHAHAPMPSCPAASGCGNGGCALKG